MYTREMSVDPYPVLAQVRAAGPAVWHEIYQIWLVARYENVAAICRDEVNFTAEDGIVAHNFGRFSMLAQDGSNHRKIRGVWNARFLRPALASIGPLIDKVCARLLSPLIERLNAGETVDFGPAARKLPVDVVSELLGISEEYRPSFARWSDEITELTGHALPPEHPVEVRRVAAQHEVAEMLRAEIAKRRRHMQDDLIGSMVASGLDDEFGAQSLVEDNCRLLLVAGNETTTKFLGNTICTLNRFPDAQAEVRADRNLLPRALEEVLRYDGVVHTGFRRAKTDDANVGGIKISVGEQIWLQFGGANRDPARYESPDTFDIRRTQSHVAFGHGFHSCLGLNLARMEGAIFINRFLDEIAAYEVAEVDYGISFPLRGPHKLMVRKH
jgi:cytochrome P450